MSDILRQIDAALVNVKAEISGNAAHGNEFSAGLSAEGYAGGYRDALHDVRQLLNGAFPNNSRFMREPVAGKRKP